MSAPPDNLDFFGPPAGGLDYVAAVNLDRNPDNIPYGPVFVCRTVTGWGQLIGWAGINDGSGTQAQADLVKVWGTKTVSGTNSQGVVTIGQFIGGQISGTLDVPMPVTNSYSLDTHTGVPSCSVQFSGFIRLPDLSYAVSHNWTFYDGYAFYAGEQGNVIGWVEGGGFVGPNNFDFTLTTQHLYFVPTYGPPQTNPPALPWPGYQSWESMLTLSNELPLTLLSDPLSAAISAFDLGGVDWNGSVELTVARWGPNGAYYGALPGIEGVDLSTQDFSAFTGEIYTLPSTEQPAGAYSIAYSDNDGGNLVMNPGEAEYDWIGAKSEVLFLKAANYTITSYDIMADSSRRNPIVVATGAAKFGTVVPLPLPAWSIPLYNATYPNSYKVGSELVLTTN